MCPQFMPFLNEIIMRDLAILEIKNKLPILSLVQRYIALKRAGNRWLGPCPFHQEKTPSFTINNGVGLFYCFGCQASGDIFSFYQQYHGVDFKETLHALADETGVLLNTNTVPSKEYETQQSFKKNIYKIHDVASNHFTQTLHSSTGKHCLEYLEKRKISKEIQDIFSLGYAPDRWDFIATFLTRSAFTKKEIESSGLCSSKNDSIYDRFRNRLIFPIRALSGQVIAFGGRDVSFVNNTETAKYINSPESPIYTKGEHLYGLYQSRKSIAHTKSIILTEGYIDVLTLHQFGYSTACAPLGTSLTIQQVDKIASLASSVQLIFDGDIAGRKAAFKATEKILAKGLSVNVLILPEGEDVDSFLMNYGLESFEDLRKTAPSGLLFYTQVLQKLSPKEIAEWLRSFLQGVEKEEIATQYIPHFVRIFGIEEEILRNFIKKIEKISPLPKDTTPSFSLMDKELSILRHLIQFPEHTNILCNAGLELIIQLDGIHDILFYLRNNKKIEDHFSTLSPQSQTLFSYISNTFTLTSVEQKEKECDEILSYLEIECYKRGLASLNALQRNTSDITMLKDIQNNIKAILKGINNA
ncbi:MAG: DNA primase [Desulfovibrionaceae bacterium]